MHANASKLAIGLLSDLAMFKMSAHSLIKSIITSVVCIPCPYSHMYFVLYSCMHYMNFVPNYPVQNLLTYMYIGQIVNIT